MGSSTDRDAVLADLQAAAARKWQGAMDFRPAWYTAAQAAHAAMDYDDEPGPAQDRRSMGGLVLAIALGVVSLIALAAMVW